MKTPENYFETQEFEYIKIGLESKLTSLCKQAGLQRYLTNGYLDQGYSLSMPYPMLELMIDFEDTVTEALDEASETAPSYIVDDFKKMDRFLRDIINREACKFVRGEFPTAEEGIFVADAIVNYAKNTEESIFANSKEMEEYASRIKAWEEKEEDGKELL